MINPLRQGFQFMRDYLTYCIPPFAVKFMVFVFATSLLILLIRIVRR